MNLTIFGAFLKDPAGEVSARIPAFGNRKQEKSPGLLNPVPCLVLVLILVLRNPLQKVCKKFLPLMATRI